MDEFAVLPDMDDTDFPYLSDETLLGGRAEKLIAGDQPGDDELPRRRPGARDRAHEPARSGSPARAGRPGCGDRRVQGEGPEPGEDPARGEDPAQGEGQRPPPAAALRPQGRRGDGCRSGGIQRGRGCRRDRCPACPDPVVRPRDHPRRPRAGDPRPRPAARAAPLRPGPAPRHRPWFRLLPRWRRRSRPAPRAGWALWSDASTAGLCHAFAGSKNGSAAEHSKAARNLQAAAAAAGQTVDAYCAPYLGGSTSSSEHGK